MCLTLFSEAENTYNFFENLGDSFTLSMFKVKVPLSSIRESDTVSVRTNVCAEIVS